MPKIVFESSSLFSFNGGSTVIQIITDYGTHIKIIGEKF